MRNDEKEKSKFSISDTVVFIVAVISLSQFFNSAHYFESGTADLQGILVAGSSAFIFVLCMTFMAYSVYKEEKKRGNLRKTFFFFDWIDLKTQLWSESIEKRKLGLNEETRVS